MKVRFVDRKMDVSGFYTYKTKTMTVSLKNKNTIIASVVMHELAHALNVRDNKYPIYHKKDFRNLNKKMKRHFIATAHRAEMFTDFRGRILFKHYFGGNDYYVGAYENTKESKDSLKAIILRDSER